MRLALVAVIAMATPGTGPASQPGKLDLDLRSDTIGVLGLPLAENAKPVFRVSLTAKVGENGEGSGVLVLDPTGPPAYDEFGFPGAATVQPLVKLDCSLKFLKKTVKVYASRRLGAPESETEVFKDEWSLYALTGPKITSRLFLALVPGSYGHQGRLLVHDEAGKVKYVIDLRPPPPQVPCHPGCFPAGTPIAVPGGTKAVEGLGVGDLITTVAADGTLGQGKVASVFVTENRLIEVRTDRGTLTTTATQPLALAGGGLRAAGELKAGDRIYTRDGRGRRPAEVRAVTATGRDAPVFNLILGEPVLFIADGFLARSKPPVPASGPVRP
jgi:hypothetical protein